MWFVTLLIPLAACVTTRPAMNRLPAAVSVNPLPITILHTNDVHGHAWEHEDKEKTKRGGYAALAKLYDTIWKDVDAKGGVTLLLSAGDVNTGYPESDLLFGEPDIVAMSHIGFDAMVLGNHEFDRGTANIDKQRQWANFPMLSANVLWKKDKKPITQPGLLLERGDVKFGIIGLTTADLPVLVSREHVEPLVVLDPIKAAKLHVKEMKKEGAEIFIALTHLGITHPDGKHTLGGTMDDRKLAEAVPELHAVVGGHSHVLLKEGAATKDGRPIVQAGHKGEYLGRLDLLWDREKKKVVSWKASVIEVLPSQGEDKEIARLLKEYKERSAPLLEEKVADAAVPLEGERHDVRSRETNLGNLLCDCLREETGAEVAVYNGGGIRASIGQGPIRMRDIYRVLPFSNTVVTARLTGAQLREALETGLKYQGQTGSFLQVSGLTVKLKAGKVVDLRVNDRPLASSKRYTVATNSFVLGGGDHLESFKASTEKRDTGKPAERVLADCLRKRGTVNAAVEGRIQTLDAKAAQAVDPSHAGE